MMKKYVYNLLIIIGLLFIAIGLLGYVYQFYCFKMLCTQEMSIGPYGNKAIAGQIPSNDDSGMQDDSSSADTMGRIILSDTGRVEGAAKPEYLDNALSSKTSEGFQYIALLHWAILLVAGIVIVVIGMRHLNNFDLDNAIKLFKIAKINKDKDALNRK